MMMSRRDVRASRKSRNRQELGSRQTGQLDARRGDPLAKIYLSSPFSVLHQMRLLITGLIAILLLGGTYLYTRFAARVKIARSDFQVTYANESITLELLRTFTAIPVRQQTLASSPSMIDSPASIRVLFKGEPIFIRENEVLASEPILVKTIPEVEVGRNEIFIFARIEPPETGELAALQARLTSQGRTIAEATFTSHQGSPLIYGTLAFDLPAEQPQQRKRFE